MKKKLCSFFLCVILVIVSAVPAFGTELSGGTGEIPGEKSILGEMLSDERNPALPEGISGKDSPSGERVVDYESPVVRNRDGMTDILRLPDNSAQGLLRSGASDSAVVKNAGDVLRNHMVNREEEVSLTLKMPSGMDYQSLAEAILDEAGKETAHSWEGDYLVYTLAAYYYHTWSSDRQTYHYTFYLDYRTTKEQESKVTAKVAEVLRSLGVSGDIPDYQKIYKVYNFICTNTVYDYFHLYLNPYYELMYTAYGALIDRMAVCQGYALLLYRMLREVGIPVRAVTGKSHGENHMWNIISLRGTWYNADSTWDAGEREYGYLLRGNTFFNGDHTRDPEFNTAEYKTSASDYAVQSKDQMPYELSAPKLLKAASAAYNKIKITWEKVPHAAGYHVYVKSGGKWKKVGSTTKTSFTYNAVTGVSYTFTVAGYQVSGGKKVQGSYSGKGITGKAALTAPVISSIKKASSGLKLSWKKVAGASGYVVYRYDNGKWVNKKMLASSSLSYTDTTAKAGKTWKYRVMAYRMVNGKAVYSALSATKSKKR